MRNSNCPYWYALAALVLVAGCGGGTAVDGAVPPAPKDLSSPAPVDMATTPADLATAPDLAQSPAQVLGGNLLIADQFNNRVIELTPTGTIAWTFGDGMNKPGPTSVVAPNDAERVGDKTLISGTGAPQNAEPGCSGMNGCPDNRVLLVDKMGKIVWSYGAMGELNTPVCARLLASGNVLITDQGNQRVIEVQQSPVKVVWQYGTTGMTGAGPNQLSNPNSAERLANGNTLIADENNNRVIEVDSAGKLQWQYGSPMDMTTLNGAAYASRLPNGNTLITDSNNNRIVEVSAAKAVVWSFVTSGRPGSAMTPNPTRAVRLANGNTLISDQNNHQVLAVDGKGSVLFAYGTINMAGSGPGLLNAPYDAKVIGDFTGLSAPK
jgi:outer membrane protein assembly factor BamB